MAEQPAGHRRAEAVVVAPQDRTAMAAQGAILLAAQAAGAAETAAAQPASHLLPRLTVVTTQAERATAQVADRRPQERTAAVVVVSPQRALRLVTAAQELNGMLPMVRAAGAAAAVGMVRQAAPAATALYTAVAEAVARSALDRAPMA